MNSTARCVARGRGLACLQSNLYDSWEKTCAKAYLLCGELVRWFVAVIAPGWREGCSWRLLVWAAADGDFCVQAMVVGHELYVCIEVCS